MTFSNSISKTFNNSTTKKVCRNRSAHSESGKSDQINLFHSKKLRSLKNSLPKTHPNHTILVRNKQNLNTRIEQFGLYSPYPLMKISSATIDRHLESFRETARRGLSSTSPSLIKNKIPIELLDHQIKEPGFIEADTVAHCGTSLAGEFVNTLTVLVHYRSIESI